MTTKYYLHHTTTQTRDIYHIKSYYDDEFYLSAKVNKKAKEYKQMTQKVKNMVEVITKEMNEEL